MSRRQGGVAGPGRGGWFEWATFSFTCDGPGAATLAFDNVSGIGRSGTPVLEVAGATSRASRRRPAQEGVGAGVEPLPPVALLPREDDGVQLHRADGPVGHLRVRDLVVE